MNQKKTAKLKTKTHEIWSKIWESTQWCLTILLSLRGMSLMTAKVLFNVVAVSVFKLHKPLNDSRPECLLQVVYYNSNWNIKMVIWSCWFVVELCVHLSVLHQLCSYNSKTAKSSQMNKIHQYEMQNNPKTFPINRTNAICCCFTHIHTHINNDNKPHTGTRFENNIQWTAFNLYEMNNRRMKAIPKALLVICCT